MCRLKAQERRQLIEGRELGELKEMERGGQDRGRAVIEFPDHSRRTCSTHRSPLVRQKGRILNNVIKKDCLTPSYTFLKCVISAIILFHILFLLLNFLKPNPLNHICPASLRMTSLQMCDIMLNLILCLRHQRLAQLGCFFVKPSHFNLPSSRLETERNHFRL